MPTPNTAFAISGVEDIDGPMDAYAFSFYDQVGDKAEYHEESHSDLVTKRLFAIRQAPSKSKDSEGSRRSKLITHDTVTVQTPSLEDVKRVNSIKCESTIAVGSTAMEVATQIIWLVNALTGKNLINESVFTADSQLESMPGVALMLNGEI